MKGLGGISDPTTMESRIYEWIGIAGRNCKCLHRKKWGSGEVGGLGTS